MEESKAPLAEGTRRAWFVALVAYFVLATYLVPSSAKVERFSFTYFALVIPAWLYVAVNWRCLLTGYGTASKMLAIFAILAGLSGILRADYPLTYNAVFLSAMAIVILNSRVYLTVAELNWMFLATLAGSVAIYGLGVTEYGFLPGQAEALGCHEAMNWRISLFRVTAESAVFSFVVLIANILYGENLSWRVRGSVALVAIYFLIFSGVRSVVFAALIVAPICAMTVLPRLSVRARRRSYVGVAFITVCILSVPYFLGAGGGFWKNYLLRTQTCDFRLRYSKAAPDAPKAKNAAEVPADWYAWTINRHCASMYQLSLLVQSPLGNQKVEPITDRQLTDIGCPTDQFSYYCASCNFSTYWLARAGIAAIPLLLCFLVLISSAVRRRDTALTWVLAAFGMVSLSWGVMFVPYNLIFLLMLALPAIAAAHEYPRERS